MVTKRVIIQESDDSGSDEVEIQSSSENEVENDEHDSENGFSDDENDSNVGGDFDSDGNESGNENDSNGEDSDGNESDNSGGAKNSAWADSVSKILKSKPKTNKPLVLSKAKKLTEVAAKPKEVGFEVVLEDGNVKKEVVEEKPAEKETQSKHKTKRKKEIPGLRVKPNILGKDRERALVKIATRGVVQLFNAVRMQQTDITKKLEKAGPLEVRKEKVMKSINKNTFLDVLMGQKSQPVDILENVDHLPKKRKLEEKEENDGKVWSVLRDNYMMDAKMKDWDKELEVEHEMETEESEALAN